MCAFGCFRLAGLCEICLSAQAADKSELVRMFTLKICSLRDRRHNTGSWSDGSRLLASGASSTVSSSRLWLANNRCVCAVGISDALVARSR